MAKFHSGQHLEVPEHVEDLCRGMEAKIHARVADLLRDFRIKSGYKITNCTNKNLTGMSDEEWLEVIKIVKKYAITDTGHMVVKELETVPSAASFSLELADDKEAFDAFTQSILLEIVKFFDDLAEGKKEIIIRKQFELRVLYVPGVQSYRMICIGRFGAR